MKPWLASQAKRLLFRSLRDLESSFLEIVCPQVTHTFGDPSSKLRAMAVIHNQRFFLRALYRGHIHPCIPIALRYGKLVRINLLRHQIIMRGQ